MTDYLLLWGKGKNKTPYCKITGKPCDVFKTPKEVTDGFEGCACACDHPADKAMEDRYEMMASRGNTPDFY